MIYDVTIIGGGPAGLYAAFQAGLYGLKAQLLEASPTLGGKVVTYSELVIHDIGGQPSISWHQLIQNLQEQAQLYPLPIRTATLVMDVSYDATAAIYNVQTAEITYQTKALVLAIGGGMVRHKTWPLLAEQTYTNVSYVPQNPVAYREQSVLLVGPGYNLMALAPHLIATAKEVHWIVAKRPFATEAEEQDFLTTYPQIDYQVQPILSYQQANGQLTAVTLANQQTVAVDAVVASFGYRRSLDTHTDWQLTPDQLATPLVQPIGQQVGAKIGVSLIANAFQEGTVAMATIAQQLHPTAKAPMVTTHNQDFDRINAAYWTAE